MITIARTTRSRSPEYALEAQEDLIADLEGALNHVSRAGAGAPAPSRDSDQGSIGGLEATETVAAAVQRCIGPLVIARGGGVRVIAVASGVVTLEASGSPGAVLPLIPHLKGLLRTAVPTVKEVRLVWPGTPSAAADGPGDVSARVRWVIDHEVNPAVAAHGGRVSLVDVEDGRVRIRLEDGCQGCSLAQVTIHQGIERLLRSQKSWVWST